MFAHPIAASHDPCEVFGLWQRWKPRFPWHGGPGGNRVSRTSAANFYQRTAELTRAAKAQARETRAAPVPRRENRQAKLRPSRGASSPCTSTRRVRRPLSRAGRHVASMKDLPGISDSGAPPASMRILTNATNSSVAKLTYPASLGTFTFCERGKASAPRAHSH